MAERELKEVRRTCRELEREIGLLQRSSTTRSIPSRHVTHHHGPSGLCQLCPSASARSPACKLFYSAFAVLCQKVSNTSAAMASIV